LPESIRASIENNWPSTGFEYPTGSIPDLPKPFSLSLLKSCFEKVSPQGKCASTIELAKFSSAQQIGSKRGVELSKASYQSFLPATKRAAIDRVPKTEAETFLIENSFSCWGFDARDLPSLPKCKVPQIHAALSTAKNKDLIDKNWPPTREELSELMAEACAVPAAVVPAAKALGFL